MTDNLPPKHPLIRKLSNILLNICFYICVAIAVYVAVQVFCFSSFRIPSDSMSPELLPGDQILVNKMAGGARIFNVSTALEGKSVKIRRLPGFTGFKRNDVLVFNFPYPAKWDSIGLDVMKYYVKRCIALPGDTLEIRNGFFHVRGVNEELGNKNMQAYISRLTGLQGEGVKMRSYPWNKELGWTIKDFGPLYIPKKGDEIELNRENVVLYYNLLFWEQKSRPSLKDDKVYLNDSLITHYRFEQNYYFMAGDKLDNSQDSRYWGLLPEEFIVGRADYICFSKEPYHGGVRRNRFMKKIRNCLNFIRSDF